tara:strand:- start:393 stop:1229 length:837 start_codon:yes stop_codon:yes gene_type:complete
MKKINIIFLAIIILGCQTDKNSSTVKKNIAPEEKVANEKKELKHSNNTRPSNSVVFRNAKGSYLTETEKDSIVENQENLQALRRYDDVNKNTEYILFKDYDDLRGFLEDSVVDDLIEENKLMRSGGRGAVVMKRVQDKWLDKPLPKEQFDMINGSIKSFSDFEGSMLVINFWYINCGPCIAEMPYLNKLVEKYKDDNIKFLALSFDSKEDIKQFISEVDFKYEQGKIERAFSYEFTPVAPGHFIIDESGIVKDILIGAPRQTELIYDRLVSVIEKNKK